MILKYLVDSIICGGIEETPRGNETRLLYAGPLDNSKAVFGVGKVTLLAEIHDEAGAFAVYTIDPAFKTILPTKDAYFAFNFSAEVKKYSDTGDTSRTAMLLQVKFNSEETCIMLKCKRLTNFRKNSSTPIYTQDSVKDGPKILINCLPTKIKSKLRSQLLRQKGSLFKYRISSKEG